MDVEQQGDVPNSKNEENTSISTTDNPGGGTRDINIDIESNTNDSTKEQIPSDNVKDEEISPEFKLIEKGHENINLESSKQTPDEDQTLKEGESEGTTKFTLPTNLEENLDLIEKNKDKKMDEADSDFELIYDDETDNELTDDALKLLDQELGIVDDKVVENDPKKDASGEEITSNKQENEIHSLTKETASEITDQDSKIVENVPIKDISSEKTTSNTEEEKNDSLNDSSNMDICENDPINYKSGQDVITSDTKGLETETSENIDNTEKTANIIDTLMNISENDEDLNKPETISEQLTSETSEAIPEVNKEDESKQESELSQEHKIDDNNEYIVEMSKVDDLGVNEKLTENPENITNQENSENKDKIIASEPKDVLDLNKDEWEDDKIETNIQLTDDALKKLDEELGISETDSIPTEEVSPTKEMSAPTTEMSTSTTETITSTIEPTTEIITPTIESITTTTEITPVTELTEDGQEFPKDIEMVEADNEQHDKEGKIVENTSTVTEVPKDVNMAENLDTDAEKNIVSSENSQDISKDTDEEAPVAIEELNKKDTLTDIEMDDLDKHTETAQSEKEENLGENTSNDVSQVDKEEPIEVLKTEGPSKATETLDNILIDVDSTEGNEKNIEIDEIHSETVKNYQEREATINIITNDATIQDIDAKDESITDIEAKDESPFKIRVLNVAEINYDNKLQGSVDDSNENDGSLNISVEKNNIMIDCSKTATKEQEFVSPLDNTAKSTDISIGIKTDHKIKRPDVMIDIPTQELIDFNEDDDDEMISDDKNDNSLTSKTVTEIVNQLESEENDHLIENNDKIETDEQHSTADTNLKNNTNKETEKESNKDTLTEDQKRDDDKMTEDTKTSEDTEATDTLDLLAESSMIPDDDEEQEPEPDDDDADGDYDDEMDHDDESSNQMTTAEHSEDSTDHPQESETQPERNFSKADSSQDVGQSGSMDATDKIDGNSELDDAENILKKEEKISEKLEEMLKSTICDETKKRRKSILLDLLSKIDDEETEESENSSKNKSDSKKQDTNIVDLEESDTEDDKKEVKKVKVDKLNEDIKKTDQIQSKDEDSGNDDEKAKEKDAKDIDEILNLDSDEEDIAEEVKEVKNNNCINNNCTSDVTVQYYKANKACKLYYNVKHSAAVVCQCCLQFVSHRSQQLLSGIKDMRPLIELEMSCPPEQLVEISDSDSDDEEDKEDVIGEETARLLEDQLDDLFNASWRKYKMDDRLKETEDYFRHELNKMEKKSKVVDELLKNCEKLTDKLRDELYEQFEPKKHELPALYIHDTPIASYFCQEKDEKPSEIAPRYPKRHSTNSIDTPAKKPAFPKDVSPTWDQTKQDDDKDVSVVNLSAEEAPAELPPPGELSRPPLHTGMSVYAMKNSFGAWLQGSILDNMGKLNGFTQCRVRFEHNVRNTCKILPARCIAYTEPSPVRLTIGTRVVALFKNTESTEPRKDAFYSGVVAEIPNPVNSYRYLVFFDDGYAQYVPHQHTRLVAESSDQVWEEVHPFSRDFVYNYLLKYPERPMVRMHTGQTISVELNGKWFDTRIVRVDASLVQVLYLEENRTEWIYRGSTRLRPLYVEFQAARGSQLRNRLPRTTRNTNKLNNVPYVEYTRSDEQTNRSVPQPTVQQVTEEQRRLRAVAKKSTGPTPIPPPAPSDGVTSRVVYYTPKHAVRPHKLTPHSCGPRCRRTDVLSLKELRTYNPLAKPLLSGWERQIVRYRGHRAVMYRGPCGRRVRNMPELHRYLFAIRSDLSVDLFDFNPITHCLAEFVLTKYNVGKKDLSHGKENVPVACVNYYDTSLPEFCSYNTERTPTAGVPLNLDPDFLCGCDCVDDCVDKSKCACWQMTLEGARTIGLEGNNIGYQYRRLLEPLPTGIYECNSRCKCKNTCLNRVAQHPLQLKLQVFKTINRGWGIRALNDVPKGAFLCIYAGNLLTDATANLDGLNEGDEYLAELDYIEVVEGMKEGYEEDVLEPDDNNDKKDKTSESEEESENERSEEEQTNDKEDGDFQPGYIGLGLTEFSKRLRKRDKKLKENSEAEKKDDQAKKDGDDCITISDDDEVREPVRFTAQEGMNDKKMVSKYQSVRDYFGKDEACYIMDAKVQGNIGRYLNHSCSPNVFVQNVFVDTHDPRFPWVSFFALTHIRAGTELTWNYNYDVGSVPGKVLYCFCGAPNCRGRLL